VTRDDVNNNNNNKFNEGCSFSSRENKKEHNKNTNKKDISNKP
jgi:hypothetical protein